MATTTNKSWIEILREPRIFEMAVFDWLASLFAAYLIGRYVLRLSFSGWIVWIPAWILFGVFVHQSLGIKTMFGYYLGIHEKP